MRVAFFLASLQVVLLSAIWTTQIVDREWYGWKVNITLIGLIILWAFIAGYTRKERKNDS